MILTYNGRRHLEICVPSALDAAKRIPARCPVVVVDNRSTDETVEWLRKEYPAAEVVVAERNDYLFSLNAIVASRPENVVVILNDDMRFDPSFIESMLPHFDDPDVFAVTAKVLDWDGSIATTGQSVGELRRFWFHRRWNLAATRPCLTLYAGGGCAAFRRSMFVELGGFDRLYHPAYCEDIDLSYRAWRRAWKVIYEPSSVIYHRVSATLKETEGGASAVTRLIRRNEALFVLRNVGDWRFIAGYVALLPVRMIRNARMGNHPMWQGTLLALPRIGVALARRWRDRRPGLRDDRVFLAAIRGQHRDNSRSEDQPWGQID